LVTSRLLGVAKIPQVAYEDAAGRPLNIDADYVGKRRSGKHPTPGPFEKPGEGELTIQVR
jgi:hypothetical protein